MTTKETREAFACSLQIWIRDDGVSADFIAARLAEYEVEISNRPAGSFQTGAGPTSPPEDQESLARMLADAYAELKSLRAKTGMTLGVGNGTGNLYVHGDYESIKACQAKLLENAFVVADRIRLEFLAEEGRSVVRIFSAPNRPDLWWVFEPDRDAGHIGAGSSFRAAIDDAMTK